MAGNQNAADDARGDLLSTLPITTVTQHGESKEVNPHLASDIRGDADSFPTATMVYNVEHQNVDDAKQGMGSVAQVDIDADTREQRQIADTDTRELQSTNVSEHQSINAAVVQHGEEEAHHDSARDIRNEPPEADTAITTTTPPNAEHQKVYEAEQGTSPRLQAGANTETTEPRQPAVMDTRDVQAPSTAEHVSESQLNSSRAAGSLTLPQDVESQINSRRNSPRPSDSPQPATQEKDTESPIIEHESVDIVPASHIHGYAKAISKALAKGHETLVQAIQEFMLFASESVSSGFESTASLHRTSECKTSRSDVDEVERLTVSIGLSLAPTGYEVSYKYRSSLLQYPRGQMPSLATVARYLNTTPTSVPDVEHESVDEVTPGHFDEYARALARHLSKGNEDVRMQIVAFMEEIVGRTDRGEPISPRIFSFEMKSVSGQLEKFTVAITVSMHGQLFQVSHSRTISLTNAAQVSMEEHPRDITVASASQVSMEEHAGNVPDGQSQRLAEVDTKTSAKAPNAAFLCTADVCDPQASGCLPKGKDPVEVSYLGERFVGSGADTGPNFNANLLLWGCCRRSPFGS